MISVKQLTIAFIALFLLSGCGPGFPIMTAEQERREFGKTEGGSNSDRIAALEKELAGDGEGRLATLDFETKKIRAELDADINTLREEINALRGEIEAVRHGTELIRESIGTVELKVEEAAARRGKEPQQQQALSGLETRVSTLASRINDIEGRLFPLEKGVLGAKTGMVDKGREKPEALYNRAILYLKDQKYKKSLAAFTRFIETFPRHALSDNSQYWIGEIYYAEGDWERAVLEFDTVVKKYPTGDKVPAALLKEGISFERLGATKEARLLMERVISDYPKSDEAAIAAKKIKQLGTKKKKK